MRDTRNTITDKEEDAKVNREHEDNNVILNAITNRSRVFADEGESRNKTIYAIGNICLQLRGTILNFRKLLEPSAILPRIQMEAVL